MAAAMSSSPLPAPAQVGSVLPIDINSHHTVAIALGFIAAVYATFCVVVMCKFWHERRRQQAHRNVRVASLSRIIVKATDTQADTGGECDICLEGYSEGDLLGRLPCSHCFHIDCIRRWIGDGISATCPRCREFV